MTYLRGNARISLLLGVTLAGSLALGACTGSASADAPLRRRPPRTTTTTEAWSDPEFSEGDVISTLKDAVPALSELPTWAIREKLLQTVCDQIDLTDGDFGDVGDTVVAASANNFEFTYGEAGSILAAAVALECPEWMDAALEYANS